MTNIFSQIEKEKFHEQIWTNITTTCGVSVTNRKILLVDFDRRICGSRQQLVQDYRSDFPQLGCHNGERVGKTTITSVSHWSDFQNQFKTSHLLWLQRKLWSYDESTVANLWTTDRNPKNKSCLLSAAACLLHCKTYRSCGLKYNCCIHYDFYNLLHPRKVGVLMVMWPADPRAFSSPSKYDKRPWGRGWYVISIYDYPGCQTHLERKICGISVW